MSLGKVVHCKREPYDVYIGRGSIWGNPFRLGPECSREQSIQQYREYLQNTPELLKKVRELRGKVLGCWCSPKPCHGDVLVEYANKSV